MSLLKEIFPWDPETISGKNQASLKNFLNGKWAQEESGDAVLIPDPLSGEPFILMPNTQEDGLAPFIESLKRCPKSGLHNPLKNVERYVMYGKICAKAAAFLKTNEGRDFFARLIQRVMPKDINQCYGEVDVAATFLENFSGDNVRFLAKGRTTPGDRLGQESVDYRWPYGPVAIITPFNFPLEIMALQLMGALFMGNKPVLKQASTTSIVAEAFVRLLLYCGMPKDDMLLIHCSGRVMEKLAANPVIRMTQFTGSSEVAHKLLKATCGRCKIEDAGFDWKILGPNMIKSMLDFVAEQCDKDAYAASGQKCSAQSILFAHYNWVENGLLDKMIAIAANRNLADLTIGPVLTRTTQELLSHISNLLKIPGARLICGGKPLLGHNIPECYGALEPTAVYIPLYQVAKNFKLATSEVFGPIQVITEWETEDDLEEVLDICERMENHLTAAVVDNNPVFLTKVLGCTVNGTTYAGIKARTTGAPQNHFFGPAGHPAAAGIGTPEAIKDTWSCNRTIIFDINVDEKKK